MFVFTIVNLFPRCLDNALMSVDAKEVAFFIQSYNSEFEEKKNMRIQHCSTCSFNDRHDYTPQILSIKLLAEIKTSTMPSVTSEVSKTTTVDKIETDVVSSKTRSVSTFSKNVDNNPLYKPLLIVSIIVGVIIVAYLLVVAVEKYCI